MKYRKYYKGAPYWSPAAIQQREADIKEALKRAAEEKLREKRRETENSR